jgi:glycerophosphoryl diester phosphodiesterase
MGHPIGVCSSRLRRHPFLDQPMPIGIAHRGGSEEAPENTVEAFGAAIALGLRNLETDAQVTRDGVVVAFHNPRLDDTTDRTGTIAEHSIAEIETADAGYCFSTDGGQSFPFRGRGVRIPRFEELLLRWPTAYILVEPKVDPCVEPLVAVIDKLDAWERVVFESFSDRRLARVRALSRGRACTSMGTRANVVAHIAALWGRMPRQGADFVEVPVRRGPLPGVTAGFLRAAHRVGLPVHVWTVNKESTMRELLELGVDGIISDRPRLLRDVLPAHPTTSR